ncbi:hypothetical protein E2C01_054685 [Portunus trituberculatus]|uniref:Uncharacterized protein n=1 Tax=Portunus trituberculatus TaxID=210409 RepID=A0A5B7GPB5_PORTR|nr:hypothetical protein [Portunus trituberculatus]
MVLKSLMWCCELNPTSHLAEIKLYLTLYFTPDIKTKTKVKI